MSTHPTLGSLIDPADNASRDAIHVAIAPFTASRRLLAGSPFSLDASGNASSCEPENAIGVVDPFLKDGVVLKGERFWGCIKPGTTSNLRHEWDHHLLPAPVAAKPEPEIVERIVEKPEDPEIASLRQFAKNHGISLTQVEEEASANLNAECRGCY